MPKASRRIVLFFLLALVSAPLQARAEALPDPVRLLFWNREEQVFGYRNMERMFPHHVVPRGETVLPLPGGDTPRGKLSEELDAFMRANNVYGALIAVRGEIVAERYREPFGPDQRWTSFSMAKSIASTLLGCAVADGYVADLDAPVADYLPELAQGAYREVTIRQVLTMTSGAAWNENYRDPASDVARIAGIADLNDGGAAAMLAFMADRKSLMAPGTGFTYSTGESWLIGELVRRATGKTLADYLSEKLWSRLGMEQDAIWVTDRSGNEISGCCFSATLRDYARYGLFIMNGGLIDNDAVLPGTWVDEASTASIPSRQARRPYGYQWWIGEAGAFQATGIFGQMIRIDRERELLIVLLSAWPAATGDRDIHTRLNAFIGRVGQAADAL